MVPPPALTGTFPEGEPSRWSLTCRFNELRKGRTSLSPWPEGQAQKKPTRPDTLRCSITSAYSLTSPPAQPRCSLSSHPINVEHYCTARRSENNPVVLPRFTIFKSGASAECFCSHASSEVLAQYSETFETLTSRHGVFRSMWRRSTRKPSLGTRAQRYVNSHKATIRGKC